MFVKYHAPAKELLLDSFGREIFLDSSGREMFLDSFGREMFLDSFGREMLSFNIKFLTDRWTDRKTDKRTPVKQYAPDLSMCVGGGGGGGHKDVEIGEINHPITTFSKLVFFKTKRVACGMEKWFVGIERKLF